MSATEIIIAALAALWLAATLLPLSRHEAWWIRGLDFPRLQLSVLLLATLVAAVLLLDFSRALAWLLVLSMLAALAWQAWWIVPYTRLFPVEVKAAPADADADDMIAVMTANVLTPNRRVGDLLRLVREHQPDLLVTLETDAWWQARLAPLEDDYPHRVACPLDNLYGMHLYSRLPLEDARIQYLVEDDVPSIHALVRLRSGRWVRLHCLHPAPPSPTENAESSERDAELIIVGRRCAEGDDAVIVTGDLNDVAWSATTRLFRKISGLLDPRVGRGMYNSYHADWWFMRWPLDHLFHSAHFRLVELRRLPGFGSDHFPVLMRLWHAGEEVAGQEAPEADADDQREARRKAAQEGVSARDVHVPGG